MNTRDTRLQTPTESIGLEAWLENTRIILPLRGLDVRAEIAAGFADVEIDQLFTQDNAQALDFRFLFPLPADAAAYRCEMHVNGRIVAAKVEQRDKAIRMFREAKAAGNRTALTECERDNLFTLQLGNLQPGDEVLMRFAYLQPLQRLRERRTLRIPVNPGVRYIPGKPLVRDNSGPGTCDDTDQVPDASRISPPRIDPAHPDAASLHAAVRLRGAGQGTLASASSPSHPLIIRQDGEDLIARLASHSHVPDRDFVFLYDEENPAAPVVRTWLDKHHRGLLEVRLPKSAPSAQATVAPDLYFLLDRSGSMGGANWDGACKALSSFTARLNPETRVWLTLFESSVRDFDAVPVRAADVDFGTNGGKIHRLGVAGGTELVPAFEHLAGKIRTHSKNRPAVVLLITDGQVGNESETIAAARKCGCPVHLVGIAMSVNDGLDRIAAQTGGRSVFLAPGEDIPGAVERFADVLRAPVVTGLTMPEGWSCADGSSLRNLCDADDFVIPISAAPDAAAFFLKGTAADGTAWWKTPEQRESRQAGLVWARARIRHLDANDCEREAVVLAKRSNLLSRHTAFIAWDKAEKVPIAQSELVQPVFANLVLEIPCPAPNDCCDAAPLLMDSSPRRKYPGYVGTSDLHMPPSAPKASARRPLMLAQKVMSALRKRMGRSGTRALSEEAAALVLSLGAATSAAFPGDSCPNSLRDLLEQFHRTLEELAKSGKAGRDTLRDKAADILMVFLNGLRIHKCGPREQAEDRQRLLADLEDIADRLGRELRDPAATRAPGAPSAVD